MLSDAPASAETAVRGTGVVLAAARQPGVTALLDIHVADGIVTHIGPAGEAPHTAPVVDLAARYVIPGLWDEHVHMTQWALAANRIDLSAAESARDAVRTVRSRLPGAAPDRP